MTGNEWANTYGRAMSYQNAGTDYEILNCRFTDDGSKTFAEGLVNLYNLSDFKVLARYTTEVFLKTTRTTPKFTVITVVSREGEYDAITYEFTKTEEAARVRAETYKIVGHRSSYRAYTPEDENVRRLYSVTPNSLD